LRVSPTYGNQFCAELSLVSSAERKKIKKNFERDRYRLCRSFYSWLWKYEAYQRLVANCVDISGMLSLHDG